jgi:hypothetical protein
MAVKEQFRGTVAVAMESSFLSVLPPSNAWILRPVTAELETEKQRGSIRSSVWREQGGQTFGGTSYAGTLEFELDTEQPGQWQFFRMLLEDRGTTGSGPTRWRFEVPRATQPESGALLFSFEGGPWVQYKGVLVERIRIQHRPGQVTRMVVQWKAAKRIETPGDPLWPISLTIFRRWFPPKDITVKLDDVTDGQIFELGFEITDPKHFGGYGADGVPTRRARDGTASLTGTLIQYWDTTTVDLAKVMRDADTFKLFTSAVDPSNGYGFELTCPLVYVDTGEPIPLGRQDVMMNASFRADLTGTGATATYIELLVSP